jgi:DNA cross-link repair 1A protein
MGITSLGPRKKIIHALGELRKKNDHTNDMEEDVVISENTNRTKVPMNGNKLITEYFRCSPSDQKQRGSKVQRPSNVNNQKNSSAKVATSRSHTRKTKVKDTPIWCCIPGTPFRVVWHFCTRVNWSIYRSNVTLFCNQICCCRMHFDTYGESAATAFWHTSI